MHYYGNIDVAFHGKASALRKLAPLVWNHPDVEDWADHLKVDPALDDDTVTTVTLNSFSDPLNAELPCIDFLAHCSPGVEIAVVGRISDSITDEESLYYTFYPLNREFYTEEDKEAEEADGYGADEEGYFDYDPMDCLDCSEEDDDWFEGYPDWVQEWASHI